MNVDLHISCGRDGIYQMAQTRTDVRYSVVWFGLEVYSASIDRRLYERFREIFMAELDGWWERAPELAATRAAHLRLERSAS